MLGPARTRLEQAGLLEDRTEVVLGRIEDLPQEPDYDAGTLIGVIYHHPGREAKQQMLRLRIT